jgi:hypothetical protein
MKAASTFFNTSCNSPKNYFRFSSPLEKVPKADEVGGKHLRIYNNTRKPKSDESRQKNKTIYL